VNDRRTRTRDLLVSVVGGGDPDLLRNCLRSIPAACGDLSYDVTVVDNASLNATAQMVRDEFPQARLIINARRLGFSANHNQVIRPLLRSSSHDFIGILNDDTELDPEALLILVRACRSKRMGVVGPGIRGTDGAAQPSQFAFPTLSGELDRVLLRRNRGAESGGWLNGSCLVLSTERLRSVGPLDERFFLFFEDTDLCRRLSDLGLACGVVPEAGMLHHGHSTIATPRMGSTMELQMLRSRYLYYDKHFGRGRAALAMVIVKSEFVLRALRATVLGRLGRRTELHKRDLLLSLIRYNPKSPLAHEVEA